MTSAAISEDSGANLTQAPKVSVVIPLYNKQDSVRRCIESALNQSWKELEVIVVDDGSTDNSYVAAEPMLTEGRVRIIRTPNRGACAARNLGVSQARGAYVAFLDADDLFEFDHIENALRLISDNVNIAHFSAAIFDRDGVRHIKARRGLREGEQMSDYYVLAHGIVDPSTMRGAAGSRPSCTPTAGTASPAGSPASSGSPDPDPGNRPEEADPDHPGRSGAWVGPGSPFPPSRPADGSPQSGMM